MSTRPRSPKDADEVPKNSVETGTAKPTAPGSIKDVSALRQHFKDEGPHKRLREKLMRAHAAIYQDSPVSLSEVSLAALSRAVSTFLSELHLQRVERASREGSSSQQRIFGREAESGPKVADGAKARLVARLQARERERVKKYHS